MRLREYAKKMGVTYKTAYRWWKAGKLDAYQLDTGTVIIRDEVAAGSGVALYARVSSLDQKRDLERQVQRLKDYAASRGYQVTNVAQEIASGLNEHRPTFLNLLTDPTVGVIVVEHKDRATRFGWNYLEQLMQMQGRRLEVLFPSDRDNELVDDVVSVITSMAARIYGKRNSRRKAEQIKRCVEKHMQEED